MLHRVVRGSVDDIRRSSALPVGKCARIEHRDSDNIVATGKWAGGDDLQRGGPLLPRQQGHLQRVQNCAEAGWRRRVVRGQDELRSTALRAVLIGDGDRIPHESSCCTAG